MELAAHIVGWALLATASLFLVTLLKLRRGHGQAYFKKLDRDLLRIGFVFVAFLAATGALIVWLTWPFAN